MGVKKIITFILAIMLFVSPLSAMVVSANFKDVLPKHDSYVAITYLQQNGTIKGYDDGNFRPDQSVNRAEVLKIILKGSKITPPTKAEAGIFPDVKSQDWFAPYVSKAKELKIVVGDEKTGNFMPSRNVNKAEFIKMLLLANKVDVNSVAISKNIPADVSDSDWFAPYMKYAYERGIITTNSKGLLEPQKFLTRAEVADMMYILILIQNSKNTEFLLSRAEAELAQIEIYIAASKYQKAKNASELAVDLTQQAYKNMPTNNVVLGAGKIAKAYDWLVDSFIYGVNKNYTKAAEYANKAIDKATDAWEANNELQPIARYIKDYARNILKQVGGKED